MIRSNTRCKLIVHLLVYQSIHCHGCIHYAHSYCLLSALLADRWRSRFSALWYSVFVQTLTIGLIGFGVCFKCKSKVRQQEVVVFLPKIVLVRRIKSSHSLTSILHYLYYTTAFLHDIFDHAILTGHDWEKDETIPDYYFVVAKKFSVFLTVFQKKKIFIRVGSGPRPGIRARATRKIPGIFGTDKP